MSKTHVTVTGIQVPALTDHCRRNKHVHHLNFNHEGRPLFIIPGIGGKSDRFRLYGNIFRKVCPVYGIDMMGISPGETPLESMQDIASQNIRWMKAVQPQGPYRLMSHSFGVYIMYEMARQLEAAGECLDFVAALDQGISHRHGITPETSLAASVLELTRDYLEGFRILVPPYPDWSAELWEMLAGTPEKDMVSCVADFICSKIPHRANSIAYCARLINVRIYNARIAYIPQGRINTKVLLIKAAMNTDNSEGSGDTRGWATYAHDVDVRQVHANHHNMLWGDNVFVTAGYIKERLQG
ncbi:thioesterase domain-containing protein [Chitinophaga sp. 22536]|uniref:thioesterase domain-containing protein n=1 Tax=unclassified Chitinophaga TaxID=2619133 RepID=UPI003F87AD14